MKKEKANNSVLIATSTFQIPILNIQFVNFSRFLLKKKIAYLLKETGSEM